MLIWEIKSSVTIFSLFSNILINMLHASIYLSSKGKGLNHYNIFMLSLFTIKSFIRNQINALLLEIKSEYEAGILKNTYDFKSQSLDVHEKVQQWMDSNMLKEMLDTDSDKTPSNLFPADVFDALDVSSDILSDIDAPLIIAE